jgi:putative redox protein
MDMEIVFPGGEKVDASYKGFTIKTDQPKHAGGEGSAPAPFDLFLASLGTCAGVYVLDFCRERRIPTEGVNLILKKERDRGSKMLRRINIDIHLPATFPAKYKNAVVKAAELCAVTRHLFNPPEMVVEAKIGED